MSGHRTGNPVHKGMGDVTTTDKSMARPDPNRWLLPELVEATDELSKAQARYDAALVAVRAAGFTDVDIISACRAAQ